MLLWIKAVPAQSNGLFEMGKTWYRMESVFLLKTQYLLSMSILNPCYFVYSVLN